MSTYIERVLITFNEDGAINGAHQERMSVDPTGTFPSRQHEPEPLDAVTLEGILANVSAIAQVAALTTQLEAALARIAELDVAPVASVSASISRRQFAEGLVQQQIISDQEATDFATMSALPAAMTAFVASLPEDEQGSVKRLLLSATEFHADHPRAQQLAVMLGWTPEQLAAFWTFCATL